MFRVNTLVLCFDNCCRFDVVSGKRKASVINTKSFGGQCRPIYSGVHQTVYRLPLSTLQYSFMVGHPGWLHDITQLTPQRTSLFYSRLRLGVTIVWILMSTSSKVRLTTAYLGTLRKPCFKNLNGPGRIQKWLRRKRLYICCWTWENSVLT